MSDTPYSARIRFVELLEREKTQVTKIKIYRDNAQVVPTSATYSLYQQNTKTIKSNVAAVVDGNGTILFTLDSSDLPSTLQLGEGYLEEFKATISGEEFTFRRTAALVRRKLYPVISDADLVQVYTDLEGLRPSTLTSYQSYIDDAFYQILRKIRSRGMGFEYLVMSPESLYESHRHLSLYLIFRDFHSSIGQSEGRFLDLAQEHYKQFLLEFDQVNWIYDSEHDNRIEEPNKRVSAQPVIYTTAPPARRRRRRY